jgi:hypothetical protein
MLTLSAYPCNENRRSRQTRRQHGVAIYSMKAARRKGERLFLFQYAAPLASYSCFSESYWMLSKKQPFIFSFLAFWRASSQGYRKYMI